MNTKMLIVAVAIASFILGFITKSMMTPEHRLARGIGEVLKTYEDGADSVNNR